MPSGSPPLSRFIFERSWTHLRGTWMWPLKVFASERPNDPNAYLEVLEVVDVLGTDVAITRGGGIFVRDRGHQYETSELDYGLVSLLNVLLCEFAFSGLTPEPITRTDMQGGKLIGRHAAIFGGGGDYAHKTWGPVTLLAADPVDLGPPYRLGNIYWPPNFHWTPADVAILKRIKGLPHALGLRKVSESLPELVVAAVSHMHRGNSTEAILTSWIVAEQILAFLWDEYRKRPSLNLERRAAALVPDADGARTERLKDQRTYSASVQAEMLLTARILSPESYAVLQAARKIRNDLAHRAKIVPESIVLSIEAMRVMIAHIGIPLDGLKECTFQSAGLGPPERAIEPDFSFR